LVAVGQTKVGESEMIDIIEAGKFYNDCLNEVRKQIVKDEIPRKDLFNEVIKCTYKLFNVDHKLYERQLVFSFVLNGITFSDGVYIDKKINPSEIVKIVSNKVGRIITEKILNETPNEKTKIQ